MANSKYDLEYDAARVPQTRTARAEALEDEGPLLVAADHWAARILPNVWESAANGKKRVTMHALEYLFIPGARLTAGVRKSCMHWTVGAPRLAKFMKDLDATGFDITPIEGLAPTALPALMRRVYEHTNAHFDDEQRKIDVEDLSYDSPLLDAETDSWYDYMSAGLLAATDTDNLVVAHFKLLMPYSYNSTDRSSNYFKSGIASLAASTRSPAFDSLEHPAQASLVAMHMRATRPPYNLEVYLPIESVGLEIARRSYTEAAARFAPLFQFGWRSAYSALDQLWPETISEGDIITNTTALAVSLGISTSGSLSEAMAFALSNKVSLLLPRVSASSKTNETRTAELVDLAAKSSSGASTGASAHELSAEETKTLFDDSEFLKLQIAVMTCGPDAHIEVARECMKHAHAAGLLFMANKAVPGKDWRARGAARHDFALQAVFNTAVSYDTSGTAKEWGSILPENTGKKWLAGGFDGNHWKMLLPVMVKREGVGLLTWYTDKEKDVAWMLDPERLRYLEGPLKGMFEVIGVTGVDTRSWHSFHRTHLRLAASIQAMPPTCAQATGLGNRLIDVVQSVYRQYAQAYKMMLAMPAHAAKRPAHFLPDGDARSALLVLDGRVDRLKAELEDGMHGIAIDPANNKSWNNSEWESHEDGWANDNGSRKRKQQWGDDESGEKQWGSAAYSLGISASKDGKLIMFGAGKRRQLVQFDTAPDMGKLCPAQLAPSNRVNTRNKWCVNPSACWNKHHETAHERNSAFPDEKCVAIEPPDDFDESELKVIKKPNSQGGGSSSSGYTSYGGRGGGGQRSSGGGRGKGSGKGAKGGKGKGSKGGKGGKGGKKSQGRRNFGWQA